MKRNKKNRIEKTVVLCLVCNKQHKLENRKRIIKKEIIDNKVFLSKTICPFCGAERYTTTD